MTIEWSDGLERGPLPLWFQIKERLRAAISDGGLGAGDQLPTEHELMDMYSVSRTTVRSALQALANEGLVDRAAGRGTFVSSSRVDQPATRLAGFHEDMVDRGYVPSARALRVEFGQAPVEEASRLGVEEGQRMLIVERLLLADDSPIAFHRSLIPQWVLGTGEPFSDADLESKSLYDLMADRSGSRPRSAEQTIEATAANPRASHLLDVEVGSPLLRVERISFDRFAAPVEWVELFYRADRYRFKVGRAGR